MPYLSLTAAAAHCDYSPSRFRVLAREYAIPTYGPSGNRYKVADLDEWMRDCGAFKVKVQGRSRRGFTRVEA
jgi:hypothetical protein